MAVTALAPPEPPPPAAGVARRAGAAAIDLSVIVGGEIFASLAFGVLLEATGTTSADFRVGQVSAAAAIIRAVTQLVLYLGPVAYLYVSWRRGASIGQRAVHCTLRSADRVTAATPSQVVLRLCGLWFSVASAGIGLVWGWFRRDRRGWSDLFAGTVVVHHPRPVYGWGAAPAWGAQPQWQAQPQWSAPPGTYAPPGWLAGPQQAPPGWPVPAPPPVAPPVVWAPVAPPAPPVWSPAPVAAAAPASVPAIPRTPWTWTDVIPVVVLTLPVLYGAEWLAIAALRWLLRGVALDTRRPIEALLSEAVAYAAVLGMVLLFVKVRRHASLADLGIRRVSWRWLLAAVPFAFLAFVLEGVTGLLSRSLFPGTPSNQCNDIRDSFSGALWLALLAVAVVAPLVEEIVFRGMVFGWLRGRVPLSAAVTVSAALFSLEHIGFLQVTLFLPIFGAGIVLAILYNNARSIWPTVIVHGTFNLIATLVLFNTITC